VSHRSLSWLLLALMLVSLAPACLADEDAPAKKGAARPARDNLAIAGMAFGAALAVGLCAMATGMAQARIGAAGAGTLAERPESAATIILLVALPETMVILGFVVSAIIIFAL